MLNFIMSHPWLLAVLGVPAVLAGLPTMIRKAELAALHGLISRSGNANSQKAIKDTIAVWVGWAEVEYADAEGSDKFKAVDSLMAKALPFLSADDRKKLIEDCVKALDEGAHDATAP